MRPFRTALLALWMTLALGCSTVRTHYDFDPTADFAAWRTYAWYPGGSTATPDPRARNPLLHRRVEVAVERQLASMGFDEQLEDRAPDFYVNFHLSVEQRLTTHTMNRTYVGGPRETRWGGMGWAGPGWSHTEVDVHDEGTLVIDFVDVAARRLVWRGSGSRRLSRDPSPERVTEVVNQAVEEILAQFPPE